MVPLPFDYAEIQNSETRWNDNGIDDITFEVLLNFASGYDLIWIQFSSSAMGVVATTSALAWGPFKAFQRILIFGHALLEIITQILYTF